MIPKFRAWLKEKKKMVKIAGIGFEDTFIAYRISYGMVGQASFDEIELMQSTGLKDKNGVEIYEGDVVEALLIYNGSTIRGKVVWCNGGACWGIEVLDSCPETSYVWFADDIEQDENGEFYVEVIGNAYENPELLEDKEG